MTINCCLGIVGIFTNSKIGLGKLIVESRCHIGIGVFILKLHGKKVNISGERMNVGTFFGH